jgi:serine protease Do
MKTTLPTAVMLGLLLAGCAPSEDSGAPIAEKPRAILPGPEDESALAARRPQSLPDFTALVSRQGPAVVNVVSTREQAASTAPSDDPLSEFFRRFFSNPQVPGAPGPREQGLGSGFIISPDGYILTNAHVVAQADEVVVRLADAKKDFVARVIGFDPRTDIALLKVEGRGLPTVSIGNSDRLQVGEWVAAIGSPFGFDNTITAGIVSAKGRNFPAESFVPYIQTDVALNPGNSGGPLLNLQGEVVGINSMIYTRTGGYMGVSFAIPIEVAMDVAQQLRATGRVSRGRLGVAIQELTPQLAKSFRIPDANGVLVTGVEAGSPADRAGLETGDVIRRYNGEAIDDSAELPRLVAATKPGAEAKLEVWRAGAAQQMRVTVGEFLTAEAPKPRPAKVADGNRLGLKVRELSAIERKELGVPFGLLVESVGEPAAATRIQPGDVITRVGQTRLESLEQFNRMLKERRPGEPLALLVHRGGDSLFILVNVA